MKKTTTLIFFFASLSFYTYAQHTDGGHPSYSSGSSGVGTINTGGGSGYSGGSSGGGYNPNTPTTETNYRPTNPSYTAPVYNSSRRSYYPVADAWIRPSTFYVRVGIGYAFPISGQTLNENGDPYATTMSFDDNQHISSYTKLKKVSFSAGLQTVAALGFMINKNIGVEVDGYLGVAPRTYTANFNGIVVDGSYPANITVTNKATTPLFVAPCFVLQNSGKNWGIYARSGPVIPAIGKVQREETYNFYAPGYHSAINQIIIGTKITTSTTIGFTAATGVKYKFNNKLSVWSELSMLSMSLYIHQEINTANIADGQYAGQFPTVNYGVSGNNVNRYNQTGIQPTYAEPFSNVSLNMGIAYGF